VACSRLSGHIQPSMRVYFTLQRSGIKLVRPLSTVDNTRDYARVSHSRQWSNYNFITDCSSPLSLTFKIYISRLIYLVYLLEHARIDCVKRPCRL